MAIRTGADYVAALRDGREVWHGGRRIDDVPSHPGFAGTVQTLAGMYDLQHTPECRDVMTVVHDGERMSYSYLPPSSPAELEAKRRNVELWSDRTLGLMGRFPDFCAGLVVGLLDFAPVLARADRRWAENARAYYRHCVERDLCLTHALTDQFYDRTKSASAQDDPDLILHVVGETPAGPVVRGLRTLATLAAVSDEAIVYPNRPREAAEVEYAIAFAIPMNAPGLKIVCRDLYGEHADPERMPFSARFDEVDTALIFDDVVVPWERVFAYRDPAMVTAIHAGIRGWATYSTMVRLVVRLETFLGLAQLLTRIANRDGIAAVQTQLALIMQDIQILQACLQASEANAVRTPSGYLAPQIAGGYRIYQTEASDRASRVLQEVLTSSLVLTGGASDLASGIGPLVERYFRSGAASTREHLRLLAMAGDVIMTQFGMRNQLYERLQSGELERMKRNLATSYRDTSGIERVRRFLAQLDEPASTPTGRT